MVVYGGIEVSDKCLRAIFGSAWCVRLALAHGMTYQSIGNVMLLTEAGVRHFAHKR